MTAKERRERDIDLYRGRLRGFSLATLSRTFDLTERQCRRIIATERKRQAGTFDRTAEERLEDVMDSYNAAVEELALEADIATSSSAKVKASQDWPRSGSRETSRVGSSRSDVPFFRRF